MKAAIKIHILKIAFILTYLLIVLTAINAWAQFKKDCGESPFSTEIIQIEKNESCYDIKLMVSYNDNVRYELSHVTFNFGSGKITNGWNSEGWKMGMTQLDPTTRISGIKIDDIQNFGKDPDFASFEVSFTYCPGHDCSIEGLSSEVAYKAGQCVYYESPEIPDLPGENSNPDDENPNPDDENPNPVDQKPLTAILDKTNPTCSELSGGSIHLMISGGTEPYEVNWNTGDTGTNLDQLSAGTYSYTITDATNNQLTGDVILEVPSEIVIEALTTNPDCQGINNGTIDLTGAGGTAPYIFTWADGPTSASRTDLFAGTYFVTVKDAKGCTSQELISLYNQTNISIDANIAQPSCQLNTSGSIDLTVSGGSGNYTYHWSTNESTASINGLDDGFYRVTATDENGCYASQTYEIVTDVGIEAYASVTKADCFDNATGAIDLTVSGGTGDITVNWSNGMTGEDISGLSSGNYTATITDGAGCQITYKVSVMKDIIPITYSGITIPSCNGSDDGAIDISLPSERGPYEIVWSDGSTLEDISGLSAGTYTVKVTDVNGCTAEKTVNLPEPGPLEISYEIITDNCSGSSDIQVVAAGGSMEYTYLWSDGSTSNELTDAAPGTYTVMVTDNKSCSGSQEIIVEEPLQSFACLISDPAAEIVCGSTNNVLSSNAQGAIGYVWSISSSDESWAVTSSADQDQVEFSAGNAGSSATISLTASFEGGCVISCEKVLSVCLDSPSPDDGTTDDTPCDETNDDGSTDDGSIDDGTSDNGSDGNGTIDDGSSDGGSTDDGSDQVPCACFFTNPVEISKVQDGYKYAIEVGYNDCRYDLSHLTIEIPECYEIIGYSNNMGWKMGIVSNDPTTGLSGIKIDDIPSFGKDANLPSFMVYFTLTASDPECYEALACFAPDIAYKAATCVSIEETTPVCVDDQSDYTVNTYPNPTTDYVKIDMEKCDKTATYTADLLDFHGQKIESHKFQEGFDSEFRIDLSSRKDGLYFLQIKSSKGDYSVHRVIKKS